MSRFVGIDLGTQGLSVVLTEHDLTVVAAGEGGYGMVGGLGDGCYEQRAEDWESALAEAVASIAGPLAAGEIGAIGLAGQMHGEVLVDADGAVLAPARLWCDARNRAEGDELTELFGCKVPRRCTVARWLWTLRNRPDIASRVRHITTPAGWIAHRLAGDWTLGVGEASGVFPIDQSTLDYDRRMLAAFDELVGDTAPARLAEMLPKVRRAGESAGEVTPAAAERFGVPAGVHVAPPEGDQPASLAGSLIGEAGMIAASFGTSVCANAVGDRPFAGVSPAVDHFCAPDGKPINMVFLRNGTTFLNTVVGALTAMAPDDDTFADVMASAIDAPNDCGGLLATPFMDDEPGLGVTEGGQAALLNLNATNANPGCMAKAALLATVFNLRSGVEVLDAQGYPRTEIILSGGLAKTPALGQVIANAMQTPVVLLASADEGCAWGAAVLAKYRSQTAAGDEQSWGAFLRDHAPERLARFEPDKKASRELDEVYRRYQQTPPLRAAADNAGRA
ncbi:MAG: FGGY family carbohydrate kinase [Planctomycetota bacterium]